MTNNTQTEVRPGMRVVTSDGRDLGESVDVLGVQFKVGDYLLNQSVIAEVTGDAIQLSIAEYQLTPYRSKTPAAASARERDETPPTQGESGLFTTGKKVGAARSVSIGIAAVVVAACLIVGWARWRRKE